MISTLTKRTAGPGLTEITADVTAVVQRVAQERELDEGLCTVFIQHTSASLVIQENADPAVCRDLEAFFRRLVPRGDPLFTHTAEGPDDMPAHVRSAVLPTQLAIPIQHGRLALGTWQGVYLYEHRDVGSARRVLVHVA
ncbi:MAG: secondary thiamine-phosphate synthase enzyme YjbQ [bacterium]|nr:secondary thiamine-phosphate synthase enzyme YjbQ [bacterium]